MQRRRSVPGFTRVLLRMDLMKALQMESALKGYLGAITFER